VVVDDFDIGWSSFSPSETDAPLVIDADGILATAVAGKRFEPVSGRSAQIVEIARGMQHIELSQGLFLNSAEAFDEAAHEQALASAVAE
jgi:hypothetical protein